jgi:hypothetical protein
MISIVIQDNSQTVVFGIPIPSTDKVFLSVIAAHVVFGLICVVGGLVAMLSKKGSITHVIAGQFYFWGMTLLYASIITASIMRWPHNILLLIVGTVAYALTFSGRSLARLKRAGWTKIHTVCMGFSYVLLLTGFYVDNGKNLPFWNQFPQWFFWIFPAIIGIPIIIRAYLFHPLNRKSKM